MITYEEFENDEITPTLSITTIPSSVSMHKWTLKKKLAYLTERKEILYAIWSLEPGGNIFSKNFYRAFANEARMLLNTEHNHMDKLKEFQNGIFKEICLIYENPEILNAYYKAHEHEMTLIRYHKDSYIKSRIIDYKNLYSDPNVSANKFWGLSASLQSEIWLLYQRSVVENWDVYMKYFDTQIRQSQTNFDKIVKYNTTYKENHPTNSKSYLYKITPKDEKIAMKKSSAFSEETIETTDKKGEKQFQSLSEKNKKDYKEFHDEYKNLEQKVLFWVNLYKYPWIKYRLHYQAFREAIDTEIMLNELSAKMPTELYDLVKSLVDYKFEKVEFIKNFLNCKEHKEIAKARAAPQEHLSKWNDEITNLMKGHTFTPEQQKAIKNMGYLRAMCIYHVDEQSQNNEQSSFDKNKYKRKTLEESL